jgi:hypothetical protein
MPRDYRKQLLALLGHYADGASDEEVQELMDLSAVQLLRLKKKLYDQEAERIRETPTEHHYIDYVIKQTACVKALTGLLDDAKAQKNANASVGAIRARSEIFDKIIKVGQEFGILEKKPEEKRIIAGVAVAQLDNTQLRQAITGAIVTMNDLVSKFGDKGIGELTPGQLHYELPEAAESKSKTNRSKTTQVHGGRRVVKTPRV